MEPVSRYMECDNWACVLNHREGMLHPSGRATEGEAEQNFVVLTLYIRGAIQGFSEPISTSPLP